MSATQTTETATKFAKIPKEVISASAAVDLLFRATSINVSVSEINLMRQNESYLACSYAVAILQRRDFEFVKSFVEKGNWIRKIKQEMSKVLIDMYLCVYIMYVMEYYKYSVVNKYGEQ